MPVLLISPRRWNAALHDALTARAAESGILLESCAAADAEWRLLEDQTDAALVSPLALAQRTADLRLLPGACVCAVGSTGDVQLRFRPGLDEIGTVGYEGAEDVDVLLARLVLIEKYGQRPVFRQVPAVDGEVPAGIDAVLLRGEPPQADTIDVVGEWFDMTELPYVREVLAIRRLRGEVGGAGALLDSFSRAAGAAADAAALADLARLLTDDATFAEQTDLVPPHHRYLFDDDAAEGLAAFFRLTFFHGLHRDIPTITLWGADEEEEGTTDEHG